MKIRYRITLWITGAGLIAGLLFSLVISYEMIEQPYELLDAELDSQAQTLLSGLSPENGKLTGLPNKNMMESIGKLYWFKVFNDQLDLIYASEMTRFAALPLEKNKSGYNIKMKIDPKATMLDEDDSKNVTFRVRVLPYTFDGHNYLIQIARPMEKLEEEITDLMVMISVGLVCFTLLLILLGYVVAGRILKPIATINTLSREITEQTLNKRIPLGESQDELYELSSSLNTMFDRLQFSFQRQKEFIANASHELKTPISMLRLFFDEARQHDNLPEIFQKRIVTQRSILYRMERLVKNLLDLSVLELVDSFTPEPVDMSMLASQILSEFKEIIEVSSIKLTTEIESGLFLQADKEKLRRVLINLIDNAIKYNSDKNKEIRFHLWKEDKSVRIEVYNTGQGIPEEDLLRVFNQFYRVEKSRSSTLGGSGLGLTIVKRIVELHHGRITLQSDSRSWVRALIEFPIN